VLTFGNRSVAGDPVTPDVIPIHASGRADHKTYFALASNSKLLLGTLMVGLSQKNITIGDREVWTLDTPLKNFVLSLSMINGIATEHATTCDFRGK
jgi:hypothetical protein